MKKENRSSFQKPICRTGEDITRPKDEFLDHISKDLERGSERS